MGMVALFPFNSILESPSISLSQNLSRNPTVNTLQRIADVIGCNVGDFFRDEVDLLPSFGICPHCGKPIIIKTELLKE